MNAQPVLPLGAPLTLTAVSRSSLVLALLQLQGTPDQTLPDKFTSADVASRLGLDESDGGVSGFLSRATYTGMLRDTGERRGSGASVRYLLEVVDVSKAPSVRESPSAGGVSGRRHRGVPKRPGVAEEPGTALVPLPEPPVSDRDRLMSMSDELATLALRLSSERFLSEASTEELLVELGRRAGCSVRAVPT